MNSIGRGFVGLLIGLAAVAVGLILANIIGTAVLGGK